MNYYRVQVALGHMGSQHYEVMTWHLATSLTPADVMMNTGHFLPGVRRVLGLERITEGEWAAARAAGQQAFRIERRKGPG